MKNLNRRQFNQLLGKGIVAVPVGMLAASLPSRANAADLVDPESATAQGLKYMVESDKGDSKCKTCSWYTAKDSGDTGACSIFGGASVPAGAWCSAYAPK